jgi:pimeloyl-ACP methyl ester carboxylesterase
MRTLIFIINGILTDPRRDDAWTDIAEPWLETMIEEPVVVFRYEYNATPLLRRWGQARRARRIAEIIDRYQGQGYRVMLVGHSNGCDLIARVLKKTQVDQAHLISPATDESEMDVGIKAGNVGLVCIYGSTNDGALKYGARASRILSLGLLGYGSLGLRGPAYAARHPGIVEDHSDNTYGHGDWISPETNLYDTLRLIARNAGLKCRQ